MAAWKIVNLMIEHQDVTKGKTLNIIGDCFLEYSGVPLWMGSGALLAEVVAAFWTNRESLINSVSRGPSAAENNSFVLLSAFSAFISAYSCKDFVLNATKEVEQNGFLNCVNNWGNRLLIKICGFFYKIWDLTRNCAISTWYSI